MNIFKSIFVTLFFISICLCGQSQKPFYQKPLSFIFKKTKKVDTLVQDTNRVTKVSIAEKFTSVKNNLNNYLKKSFVNFKDNNLYLYAGMGLSKQTIQTGDYISNFNYDLSNYNKSTYKPGYFVGARVDGMYNQKHPYTFGAGLQKITSGTQYKDPVSLAPFLGDFSKFKADDQFFSLNVFAHYRKLISLKNNSNRKFYLIAGPNIDTRLSSQSIDNQVNYNYRRFLLRADIGVEYDNSGYYTVFVHYKQAISSFTKAPIRTNLNSIEIGMQIKASDIF
jgi:hypothetical protein